jgi:frataxin-like iron-binding protein CyaY
VIVVASKVPSAALWVFSMPNGYAFTCQTGEP